MGIIIWNFVNTLLCHRLDLCAAILSRNGARGNVHQVRKRNEKTTECCLKSNPKLPVNAEPGNNDLSSSMLVSLLM